MHGALSFRPTGSPVTARIALLALLTTGCSGPQSMLDPAGPGAAAIAGSWWFLLVVVTAVFLVVMAALGRAIFRSRPEADESADIERRRVVLVILAGAAVPAVILAVIFVHTLLVLEDVSPPRSGDELVVEVVGRQYWWEVRYPQPGDADTVVTANEIHVPVGRPVSLTLRSEDVIHSLWVPRLHGKTDMIPGRTNVAWLRADEPGEYRGQCAEYCGRQHTWMALYVVAEPEEEFRAWLARQRRPAAAVAPAPDSVSEAMDHPGPPVPDSVRAAGLARNARIRRGREVFLDPANRCVACHTVRGETDGRGTAEQASPGDTAARTVVGPDLTHVASRRTLAAGLLRTNRGNMAGWIANPQVLKPGNLMPRIPLEPAELNALLDYLMSLR